MVVTHYRGLDSKYRLLTAAVLAITSQLLESAKVMNKNFLRIPIPWHITEKTTSNWQGRERLSRAVHQLTTPCMSCGRHTSHISGSMHQDIAFNASTVDAAIDLQPHTGFLYLTD